MYQLIILSKAERQLKQLDVLIQERILEKLERIKFNPFRYIKRKQGVPYFILRIGKYRAILDIKKNKLIILVLEIGPRGKIYK